MSITVFKKSGKRRLKEARGRLNLCIILMTGINIQQIDCIFLRDYNSAFLYRWCFLLNEFCLKPTLRACWSLMILQSYWLHILLVGTRNFINQMRYKISNVTMHVLVTAWPQINRNLSARHTLYYFDRVFRFW